MPVLGFFPSSVFPISYGVLVEILQFSIKHSVSECLWSASLPLTTVSTWRAPRVLLRHSNLWLSSALFTFFGANYSKVSCPSCRLCPLNNHGMHPVGYVRYRFKAQVLFGKVEKGHSDNLLPGTEVPCPIGNCHQLEKTPASVIQLGESKITVKTP
jgi:hypothetical protein